MIIYFSVQNFRSIRDKICLDMRATSDKTLEDYYVLEIPKPKIKVLKMAMIYGLNASGKTNIFLALDFLRRMVIEAKVNKEQKIEVTPFALDQDKLSEFEIQFYHQEIVYRYTLRLDQQAISNEKLTHFPNGKEALIFERTLKKSIDDDWDYDYQWTGAKISNEQSKFLELVVQNQTVLSRLSTIKYSGPIQYAKDWFGEILKPILRPVIPQKHYATKRLLPSNNQSQQYTDFCTEMLTKADFLIEKFELIEEEYPISDFLPLLWRDYKNWLPKIYDEEESSTSEFIEETRLLMTHGSSDGEFKLDFQDESAGTRRYFHLIGFLWDLIYSNRAVLIDEIENALHIELQLHFIETFLRNSSKGQLIFTSHNTALLNEREVIRRDAVWITDRSRDGVTKLASVADYPVRKEHAIDRVYRRGFLGGVPNLGSTVMEKDCGYKKKK